VCRRGGWTGKNSEKNSEKKSGCGVLLAWMGVRAREGGRKGGREEGVRLVPVEEESSEDEQEEEEEEEEEEKTRSRGAIPLLHYPPRPFLPPPPLLPEPGRVFVREGGG